MKLHFTRLPLRIASALTVACIFTPWAGATTPALPTPPPTQPSFHYDVRSFGATGNGTSSDTVAIQNALSTAGSHSGGATVDIPSPGTYLTGSLIIPSNVWLNVEAGGTIQGSNNSADYPLTTERWEGSDVTCHRALISADNASNVAVVGGGTINGGGSVSKSRNPRGPTLFEPRTCKGVFLQGVTVSNHGCWTIHPTFSQDVTVSGITINSDGTNGDGCDPDSCARVLIDKCSFSTGDDCIALKSGINQEGVDVGIPTEDVTITNCEFVKVPQGAVALGSELSGGLQRILIKNCTFGSGAHAVYIKSREGRGGYCMDVTADTNTFSGRILEVTGLYNATLGTNPVPGLAGVTQFSNITVTNVVVRSSSNLASLVGDSLKPINGVTLSNFSGTSNGGVTQSNATNVTISNINVAGSGISAKGSSTKFEVESLPVAAISSGTTDSITMDSRYSGGAASMLNGTAIGNFITYAVPNLPAGNYDVRVGVKKHNSRGIWQLAIGDPNYVSGSPVSVGPQEDNYSASDIFTEVDLGIWSSATTGDKWFRFTIVGKNANSSGYTGIFDYITLVAQ